MAERALRREVTPHLLQPRHRWQLVADTGGEDDGIRGHHGAGREGEPEAGPVPLDRLDPLGPDRDGVVCRQLPSRGRAEVCGWGAVVGEDVVHVGDGRVAVRAVVEDGGVAADPPRTEGCLKPGRPATDDRDVGVFWLR